MHVDDTKNYKRDNPVSMTRRIQTKVTHKGKNRSHEQLCQLTVTEKGVTNIS